MRDEISHQPDDQTAYDALTEEAQAVRRAAWEEQISQRLATLDLTEDLRAAGQPWFEADADGNVITRRPATGG